EASDVALVRIGALTSCMGEAGTSGYPRDPVEQAMLQAAKQAGIPMADLERSYSLKKEFSFDNNRKLMSVTCQSDSGGHAFVKGAPEAVLERSSRILYNGAEAPKTERDEQAIRQQVESMAGEAMRLIGLAYKQVPDAASVSQEEAENGLVFAGIVGLADPLRPGVEEALEEITAAGVKTVVISGDHPLTVEKVAAQAGIATGEKAITGGEIDRMTDEALQEELSKASLFARTTPDQKLRIVTNLRRMGHVVAVTGDGINDAPALKSADIGIAMGQSGTEVARETADMVLRDDSFISIVAGVREGRKIYDNLKKGIGYYLCVKVALVLSFVVALAVGVPFPFAPIQIILLELFMDLAASATFVAEPVEHDVMRRPPRSPRERFVGRTMLQQIAVGSLGLAGAVMINYLVALNLNQDVVQAEVQAQTLAFATWLIGHVFLAFNMRSRREPLWKIGFFSNRVMLLWAGAVLAFIIVVTGVPVIQAAVKVTSLDARSWAMALAVPFVTTFWMQLGRGNGTGTLPRARAGQHEVPDEPAAGRSR
ncbi:MAG: cation-transporting P-type ATPase, partial [Chloroflexi bacterium]|nr:cation-transporting P-type ATPase [Chloroflexota bacterium]